MVDSLMVLVAPLALLAHGNAAPVDIRATVLSTVAAIPGPAVELTFLVLGDPLATGRTFLALGILARAFATGLLLPLGATPGGRRRRRRRTSIHSVQRCVIKVYPLQKPHADFIYEPRALIAVYLCH